MSGHEDIDDVRRHHAPYGARHPIPTISKYREEKAARQDAAMKADDDEQGVTDTTAALGSGQLSNKDNEQQETQQQHHDGDEQQQQQDDTPKDTSEIDPGAADPRQRMKEIKSSKKGKDGNKKERAEREVTDPVTHLPITIHDFTDQALENVDMDKSYPQSDGIQHTTSGLSEKAKGEKLSKDKTRLQQDHGELVHRFPPPDFDALRQEMSTIANKGITFGLIGLAVITFSGVVFSKFIHQKDGSLSSAGKVTWFSLMTVGIGGAAVLTLAVRDWISRRISNVFEDEVWEAQRELVNSDARKHETETTVWLNSLLGSVWPMINPDLFASLGDTLEDVMQASLPKLVRMVSVDDIGQGSEAIRILGVRWLPRGAATDSVTQDGGLTSEQQTDQGKDGEKDDNTDGEGHEIQEGMEAEDGEFINLEVAFAYRSRSSSDSMRSRTKDIHLCLAFYMPGNLKLPVWVDLRGIIGTVRLRLQLTPDPPFFELCTLTFLGQPKVDLSCTPLTKHGLNIMDVPFISNFVQASIDAAMSQYVAPKSLVLNLKDMLAGEDYKKDTTAKGILMIRIVRGYDFKMADTGIPLVKDGSSDPYVSVGWAKFGKVLWSTRILISEMEPHWDEHCFVLVTDEELNVDERIRIQLWDSDRVSADDDLGRIEVDVKEIMKNKESNGRMQKRTEGFRALKPGDGMPGKLEWEVGYFSKTRLQKCQYEHQSYDPEIRSLDDLKSKVNASCEKKLREAMIKDGKGDKDEDKSELDQLKEQEFKATEDAMIISAPPPEGYPSGVFSLQIHNIMGLELGRLSKDKSDKASDGTDDEETGESLPSAYCTIIINHRKVYKTRTKPQNSKPFFNAGTERFVGDWRECEAYVSVRDSRVDEDDALLGIVHLPLYEIFREKSQLMGTWPLAGGIGHGKIRLSMVWRSVQLQAPPNLLGWDCGTVEVQHIARFTGLDETLQHARLKFKTNLDKGKMYANREEKNWHTKRDQSLRLAVHRRYASCMSISFKTKGAFKDDTVAFCVLWLKDLPDEEQQELELPVWKGDFKRATANCVDEPGERLGTVTLTVTFWAGLGGAHSGWANKDPNLRDVVEVINVAQDNHDFDKMERKAGIVDEEVSSDSDSSDEEGDVPDGSAGQKQGPIDQAKDYKRREQGLHRQHRGLMQWKIPRTAKWVKHKAESVGDKVEGVFDRKTGQTGIETEV
ncbi:uncharacterized protein F5Z01DRAFT_619189 [Emericellopsis atlantica]|uniref:Meiotically up-regulated gene 190 protein n=1 Tax=Emericellopsis atlantica TaxID=2614577 RepID=A0A9P7ZQN8_9HYPO|nr:uncharacterized protein F5Z01DRAFT_619189 [Emericellopsis atlantica]KAG9256071.1 hypothetical protein F5Z01DRAFT_619189 [Emericellopsis atlantica]